MEGARWARLCIALGGPVGQKGRAEGQGQRGWGTWGAHQSYDFSKKMTWRQAGEVERLPEAGQRLFGPSAWPPTEFDCSPGQRVSPLACPPPRTLQMGAACFLGV